MGDDFEKRVGVGEQSLPNQSLGAFFEPHQFHLVSHVEIYHTVHYPSFASSPRRDLMNRQAGARFFFGSGSCCLASVASYWGC